MMYFILVLSILGFSIFLVVIAYNGVFFLKAIMQLFLLLVSFFSLGIIFLQKITRKVVSKVSEYFDLN